MGMENDLLLKPKGVRMKRYFLLYLCIFSFRLNANIKDVIKVQISNYSSFFSKQPSQVDQANNIYIHFRYRDTISACASYFLRPLIPSDSKFEIILGKDSYYQSPNNHSIDYCLGKTKTQIRTQDFDEDIVVPVELERSLSYFIENYEQITIETTATASQKYLISIAT